jgi:Na+/H+ antiporter NhaD/arsenite permease-like protein
MQQQHTLDMVQSPIGLAALAIFVVALRLRGPRGATAPAQVQAGVMGAGLIWALIACEAAQVPALGADFAANAFGHVFLEFAELFFFLIVAMSFVAAMTERGVFEWLRAKLVGRGFSYRQLFWLTGLLAFFCRRSSTTSPRH